MQNAQVKRVAFLWDESFLWGIMAHKALVSAGLPFELVRAEDVRKGCLERFSALFVPGGWASNKIKALGDGGVEAIKRFVHAGGSYAGFCGGAGLATLDGIGLLAVKRRPSVERVPSFSGPIRIVTADHAIWRGIDEPVFHAWWPSQFVVAGENVQVLAAYGAALPDAFSSDVNVGDAEAGAAWPELERLYQINLNPNRLDGEPAVIEGTFGKGKVVLSLLHFDTPGDRNGDIVLRNLWNYLAPDACCAESTGQHAVEGRHPTTAAVQAALLAKKADELISLGQRNFLWFWRNPMLLQWRRGVRGLEYCTLFIVLREIADRLNMPLPAEVQREAAANLEHLRERLLVFVERAERLLLRERYAMQTGHITYEKCDDADIQTLRDQLFSKAKSHGGLFKEVVDALDAVLFTLYRKRTMDA